MYIVTIYDDDTSETISCSPSNERIDKVVQVDRLTFLGRWFRTWEVWIQTLPGKRGMQIYISRVKENIPNSTYRRNEKQV